MKAVFMMGLPLAGKSTWILNSKLSYPVVSADELKETHTEYDPNNPESIHEWSVRTAEEMVKKYIETKQPFIMDGGGINTNYTKDLMKMAQRAMFEVKLVHIKTPYYICIERLAHRVRKVPVDDIKIKAVKENAQFHILKEHATRTEVVDYFTNQHIFIDMDGVIAAQGNLPEFDGEIDFVNGKIHKYQQPVLPVINRLLQMQHNLELLGHVRPTYYILSATPTSFSTAEKNQWLDIHFNIPKDRRFFVNQGRHKAEMMENLSHYLKLDKKDMLLVDDYHQTLADVYKRGMNSMHVSEFLTHDFY